MRRGTRGGSLVRELGSAAARREEGAEALGVLDDDEAVQRGAEHGPLLGGDDERKVDRREEVPLERVEFEKWHSSNLRISLVPVSCMKRRTWKCVKQQQGSTRVRRSKRLGKVVVGLECSDHGGGPEAVAVVGREREHGGDTVEVDKCRDAELDVAVALAHPHEDVRLERHRRPLVCTEVKRCQRCLCCCCTSSRRDSTRRRSTATNSDSWCRNRNSRTDVGGSDLLDDKAEDLGDGGAETGRGELGVLGGERGAREARAVLEEAAHGVRRARGGREAARDAACVALEAVERVDGRRRREARAPGRRAGRHGEGLQRERRRRRRRARRPRAAVHHRRRAGRRAPHRWGAMEERGHG